MKVATQLAIFLANQPGALARVCQTLAEADINIYAITTSDTVDHSVVRMVVSDPRKALFIFEEHGTLVVENEVLLIDVSNRPGGLAALAKRLACAKINIEYLYSAASPEAAQALIVLRVPDPAKAKRLLSTTPRRAQ